MTGTGVTQEALGEPHVTRSLTGHRSQRECVTGHKESVRVMTLRAVRTPLLTLCPFMPASAHVGLKRAVVEDPLAVLPPSAPAPPTTAQPPAAIPFNPNARVALAMLPAAVLSIVSGGLLAGSLHAVSGTCVMHACGGWWCG